MAERLLEKSLRVQSLLLRGRQSIFPQSKLSKLIFTAYFKIKQEISDKTLFIDIYLIY